MPLYFAYAFASAQHPALRLSGTKNLHFAIAPFPRFSAIADSLTHSDIALRIGSGREMVTRILSELEKGEYLSITNKIITLNRKLPPSR
jgi:CRP-like cAMP-binding protein